MMSYDVASSAHFQPPVSPGYVGGPQPSAPPTKILTGLSVDNIQFNARNLAQVHQAIAQAQPDPWVYDYTGGGAAPYGQRELCPQLTVPTVNAPPVNVATSIEVGFPLAAQPDPWVYLYEGASAPYGPHVSAAPPGVSVSQPVYDRRRAQLQAELMGLAFPDPWTYQYLGCTQPYGPRLPGGYNGNPVNTPPSTLGGPTALAAELALAAQPDPWAYASIGLGAPYVPPRTFGASATSLFPPYDRRGLQTIVETAALAQADPWSFLFLGAQQPYQPHQLGPWSLSVDRPPQRGLQTTLQTALASQPDPWPYVFVGGPLPYAPKILNAQMIFVEVDQPQPNANVFALVQAIQVNQPDPWTYLFLGANLPYLPRQLSPAITAVKVDQPPINLNFQVEANFYLAAQPDPWSYALIGSLQPYASRVLNPSLTAVRVDTVPSTRLNALSTILTAWIAPDVPAQDLPPQPYRQKITVRIGRSRGFVLT